MTIEITDEKDGVAVSIQANDHATPEEARVATEIIKAVARFTGSTMLRNVTVITPLSQSQEN